MALKSSPHKTSQGARIGQAARTGRKRDKAAVPPASTEHSNPDPVPFKVTAFAAAVFPLPAISDAVEDGPLFDKSIATPVAKRKKA